MDDNGEIADTACTIPATLRAGDTDYHGQLAGFEPVHGRIDGGDLGAGVR